MKWKWQEGDKSPDLFAVNSDERCHYLLLLGCVCLLSQRRQISTELQEPHVEKGHLRRHFQHFLQFHCTCSTFCFCTMALKAFSFWCFLPQSWATMFLFLLFLDSYSISPSLKLLCSISMTRWLCKVSDSACKMFPRSSICQSAAALSSAQLRSIFLLFWLCLSCLSSVSLLAATCFQLQTSRGGSNPSWTWPCQYNSATSETPAAQVQFNESWDLPLMTLQICEERQLHSNKSVNCLKRF